MGWNGSGAYSRNKTDIGKNRLRSNTPVIRTRNSNYLVWGVLALLLIFAGVAYFAFVSDESVVEQVEEKPKKKTRRVATVKSHVATNIVKKAETNKNVTKAEDYWKDKIYVDEKGVKRYPGGARWLDPNRKVGIVKHPVSRMGRLFKYHSERHIAGLLELEPGTPVFGTVHYRKDLNKDFLESCNETIEFSEDDTPEDRELKLAVAETKKDLMQRVKAGEDFAQILKEARDEAQRMGAYRSDLKKQIDEIIRDESYTDKDVEDFTKAANMMLEKEGLPGLKAPHILVRQEILRRARERKSINQ